MSHGSVSSRPSENFALLRESGLTPRQCEVLGWVAHGKRDADIAKILGIATKTVGKHVEHLLVKLHAENRTAAASLARERLRALADPGEAANVIHRGIVLANHP